MESNQHDNVLYVQPMTLAEHTEAASACELRLDLTLPMLINDLENSTDRKYYALPDRLYRVVKRWRCPLWLPIPLEAQTRCALPFSFCPF